MQKTTLRSTSLTAVTFFLIGTLAVAQAPSTARKKLPGRMKSGQLVVTGAQSDNGSGTTTPQSTEATDRKSGSVVMTNDAQSTHRSNARNSAHATESTAPSDNVQQGENPLYEDHGKSGTNPLYEGREKSSVNAQHYDGDPDRPMSLKQDSGQVPPRKHPAGVKYEDRTAAGSSSSSGQSAPASHAPR